MTDTTEPDDVETDIDEIEETFTREAFIARLRALADALEAGAGVEIEIAGETIALPKDAIYSVEYEGDEDEEEIEFQIKWSRPEEE